jgi:hypothetical protein
MTQNTYDVSYSGVLVEGTDLSQVKANVAKLFRTEVQKIEVMFSGKRVVIKRDLDEQSALKYMAAMKQAGAICELTEKKEETVVNDSAPKTSQAITEDKQEYSAENPPPIPAPTSSPSTTATPTVTAQSTENTARQPQETSASGAGVSIGEMASVTIAPPGETIIEHEKIEEPVIDISAISVDDSKNDLVEHRVIPEPDIDISAISVDRSGEDLVQHETVAEPAFDISAISMDETGVDLVEHEEVAPLEVDISNISMAPPGSPVLEDNK